MFTIVITEKGGASSQREFDQPEVTIGRVQGNDIVLPKSNISKRHARIINNNGSFVVVDSKSTNGTYINGKRIDAPYDLKNGDKIFVGDFTMEIMAAEAAPAAKEKEPAPKKPAVKAPPPPPPPVESESNKKLAESDLLSDDEWGAEDHPDENWADDWGTKDGETNTAAQDGPSAAALAKRAEKKADKEPPPKLESKKEPAAAKAAEPRLQDIPTSTARRRPEPKEMASEDSVALRAVHERLIRSLDLRRMDVSNMGDEELRARTRDNVRAIVDEMQRKSELPKGMKPDELIDAVLDEALGLGPLEDLLADEGVTEIMVNGAKQIFLERAGKIETSERTFSSDQAVLGVIERIVAPLGRRIDESSPMVDARLKDGSRVNAIIPPLALNGPTLTIRKFTKEPLHGDELVAKGTLTAPMTTFLETSVRARKNIVVSGGTGSGKTTMLGVMSSYIPDGERIVTIEDAAELKLDQTHVVRLESRPPNIEGRGEVTIRDLVRNALRMNPRRIIVGECRGGEALDMLQAMNTGHEGSLTTVHANGPRDALSRLETMVLMSGMELPVRAIRDQISSAIDIIVQLSRFPDGSRRVTHISEVTGMESDVISMQDIFVYEQEGFDAKGRVQGRFKATGFIPRFYEGLKALGIEADLSIFRS